MNNEQPQAVTEDGKDISESSDIKLIYPKTLISQNEYEKLIKILGKDFLTFYLGKQNPFKRDFAEDVGICASVDVSMSILFKKIDFLQEDGETFNENKYALYSDNLTHESSVFYEKISHMPADFLTEILEDLNFRCKECRFKGAFFEINEYIKNGVKVKLQKAGFRRMFSIDYIFSENEKHIFNISLTVNNLENKVKYWLRFYDSDKCYSVILSCQMWQNRNDFIDKYPYLTFILDLIHQ